MIRNILFTGCSFTWGQSLHYHGNFDDDIHPRDGWYHEDKILPHHYQYQVDSRFATKVADYFCRKPLVSARNGGDNWNIAEMSINQVTDKTDAVIVQTTAYSRSFEQDGYTVEDQLKKFEEVIEINSKRNIPVKFIHYGDLDESQIPLKILNNTIYINGNYSFWELIFKPNTRNHPIQDLESKYTIGNYFSCNDDHLNQVGHDLLSSLIIEELKKYIKIPKYE